MPTISTTFTYSVSGIFMQNIEETIKHFLHDDAKILGQQEVLKITDRTRRLTGALIDSISYEDFAGMYDVEDLLYLYANEAEQLSAWGRVYVQYQEGGVLGLPTYTNPPREMFARVLTEDLRDIGDWGVESCQRALDACVAGKGVPI